MKVNYDEVVRFLEFKKKVNEIPLNEIEWVRDDGSSLPSIAKKVVDEWRFTGLCNTWFAHDIIPEVLSGKIKDTIWGGVEEE